MPELPDVESLRRHLVKQGLIGRTITGATVFRPATIKAPEAGMFARALSGRRIMGSDRRGKYLLFALDGPILIVHLRMTGKLEIVPGAATPDPRTRVAFALDSGQELRFLDWRSLGKVWLVDDAETVVGKLGPEPLGPAFTVDYVRRALDRPRAMKPLLLDQTIFAGVGNLYADEILWRTKIHPLRLARELSVREVHGVHDWTRELLGTATDILERSLDEDGEFLAENGRGARKRGSSDLAREVFLVDRDKGALCARCGTALTVARVGGRGTHFCPHCQTLDTPKRFPVSRKPKELVVVT